jgi:hypothetical protein
MSTDRSIDAAGTLALLGIVAVYLALASLSRVSVAGQRSHASMTSARGENGITAQTVEPATPVRSPTLAREAGHDYSIRFDCTRLLAGPLIESAIDRSSRSGSRVPRRRPRALFLPAPCQRAPGGAGTGCALPGEASPATESRDPVSVGRVATQPRVVWLDRSPTCANTTQPTRTTRTGCDYTWAVEPVRQGWERRKQREPRSARSSVDRASRCSSRVSSRS